MKKHVEQLELIDSIRSHDRDNLEKKRQGKQGIAKIALLMKGNHKIRPKDWIGLPMPSDFQKSKGQK